MGRVYRLSQNLLVEHWHAFDRSRLVFEIRPEGQWPSTPDVLDLRPFSLLNERHRLYPGGLHISRVDVAVDYREHLHDWAWVVVGGGRSKPFSETARRETGYVNLPKGNTQFKGYDKAVEMRRVHHERIAQPCLRFEVTRRNIGLTLSEIGELGNPFTRLLVARARYRRSAPKGFRQWLRRKRLEEFHEHYSYLEPDRRREVRDYMHGEAERDPTTINPACDFEDHWAETCATFVRTLYGRA